MTRRFVSERRRDPYYRAAQREGLRSRAAFKLAHLAERFPILRIGSRVLDLGAAPGGWSLVALDRVGPHGEVVGVDLRPIEPADRLTVVRGRVGDADLRARLGPQPFDVVLSDLSPRISGAYATDHARSVDLVRAAANLAIEVLAEEGAFVAKLFDGDLRAGLEAELSAHFSRFTRTKPPASREQSSEIYLIGLGFVSSSTPRRSPRASDRLRRDP
ncbi:MAG: RlmE family RNA methyltransferase [Thermoplasmata archaeon]